MNKPEFDYRFMVDFLKIIDKYSKNRNYKKLNFVENIVFDNN